MEFYEALFDSIKEWEHKVRRETQDGNFRAIPHLAKVCDVEKRAFYNWLDGDNNGCKIGVKDLVEIIAVTKDYHLLDILKDEIVTKVKLNNI